MNYTTTTNGAITNQTSGKECLDLFQRIGKEGGINNELKTKILKTATIYKIEKKKKNPKPYKAN